MCQNSGVLYMQEGRVLLPLDIHHLQYNLLSLT